MYHAQWPYGAPWHPGGVLPVTIDTRGEFVKVMAAENIVAANVTIDGKVYEGVARCHPDDDFNLNIGERLALARALLKAGREMRQFAYNSVDAAERRKHGSNGR